MILVIKLLILLLIRREKNITRQRERETYEKRDDEGKKKEKGKRLMWESVRMDRDESQMSILVWRLSPMHKW